MINRVTDLTKPNTIMLHKIPMNGMKYKLSGLSSRSGVYCVSVVCKRNGGTVKFAWQNFMFYYVRRIEIKPKTNRKDGLCMGAIYRARSRSTHHNTGFNLFRHA